MSDGPPDAQSPAGRSPPLRAWAKLGYLLLVLSVPALLEIFFEVVILTSSSGPQMLFYSIIHTASGPVGLVLGVSVLAIPVYAVYALGLLVARGLGKLAEPGRHFRIMMVWLAFQALLFVLLLTYDYWAYALFARK